MIATTFGFQRGVELSFGLVSPMLTENGCCLPERMSCRARLVVAPHSATSSARGDDMSTTVVWNSGVYVFQYDISVNTLAQDASHRFFEHALAVSWN